jgi:deoxycytidylate deaminase
MYDHTNYMYAALVAASMATGFNNKNKTGAVIVHRNRVIAIGRNSPKTHPLARTFSKHPEAIYLHAEIDAIVKVKDSSILKDSSIYIARMKNDRSCGISKPCNGCAAAISHFNFSLVAYSLDFENGMKYIVCDRKRNTMLECKEV